MKCYRSSPKLPNSAPTNIPGTSNLKTHDRCPTKHFRNVSERSCGRKVVFASWQEAPHGEEAQVG